MIADSSNALEKNPPFLVAICHFGSSIYWNPAFYPVRVEKKHLLSITFTYIYYIYISISIYLYIYMFPSKIIFSLNLQRCKDVKTSLTSSPRIFGPWPPGKWFDTLQALEMPRLGIMFSECHVCDMFPWGYPWKSASEFLLISSMGIFPGNHPAGWQRFWATPMVGKAQKQGQNETWLQKLSSSWKQVLLVVWHPIAAPYHLLW